MLGEKIDEKSKKVISLLFVIVLLIGILSGCKENNYKNNANTNVPFSGNNATVYFALTNRFLDGDESKNHSYGRELDETSNETPSYKNEPATFHVGAENKVTVDVSSVFEDETKVRKAYTGNSTTVKDGKPLLKHIKIE
jgi:alpha-amylase